jgi:hypothetical protein
MSQKGSHLVRRDIGVNQVFCKDAAEECGGQYKSCPPLAQEAALRYSLRFLLGLFR